MRQLLKALAPVVAIGASACSDPVSITVGALEGTWDAIQYAYVDPGLTYANVELVGRGARLTIVFRSDGTYTWDYTDPAGANTTVTGTFTVTDDEQLNLTDVGDGTGEAFLATRDGDRMTLETGLAEWDFDEDGTPERAIWRIFLTRGGVVLPGTM